MIETSLTISIIYHNCLFFIQFDDLQVRAQGYEPGE